MVSKELSKYIESLRKRRNINLVDFTEGIVSQRQYKRYLSGDSEMPYRAFVLFAEKLGFNPVKIQGDLEDYKIQESELIADFYNLVIRHKYKEAEAIMKKLDIDDFVLPEFKSYYLTTVVLLEFYRDKKPKEECRDEILKIIGYPEILQKDLFHQIELIVLSISLMFVEGTDKLAIMDKLNNQLLKDKITLGTEYYARQYVVLRVAREYAIEGFDDKVIHLCLNSLELSRRPKIHFNYDFLYYYLSLAYRNKKDTVNEMSYLRKLYHYLLFLDDETKMKNYNNKIIKDYGSGFKELFNK